MSTNNRAALTYGIDTGAPNGDMTALAIKQGETVYSFVGQEAEVIIALLRQAKREALEDLNKRLALAGDLRTARIIASDMLAALVALQVGPQGVGGDLGDSDSSGGVSGSEQIKSYATPDEPTEGSL